MEFHDDRAIEHLGNVLVMLANLAPGQRCQAFDDALSYYNDQRPAARVLPMDDYLTLLVTVSPLDWQGGLHWPENTDHD